LRGERGKRISSIFFGKDVEDNVVLGWAQSSEAKKFYEAERVRGGH